MLEHLTGDYIDELVKNALPILNEDPTIYTKTVLTKVFDEQPDLYSFSRIAPETLFIASSPLHYGLGASFAYELLPENEKRVPLGKKELESTKLRLLERNLKEGLNLSWFIDFLIANEPVFFGWLQGEILEIEGQEKKASFLLGVTVITLPFFIRKELLDLVRLP